MIYVAEGLFYSFRKKRQQGKKLIDRKKEEKWRANE